MTATTSPQRHLDPETLGPLLGDVLVGKKGVFQVEIPVMPDLTPEQFEDGAAMAAWKCLGNFSEAGTGKTLTTLHALDLAQDDMEGQLPTLIVCPISALRVWCAWIQSYFMEDSGAVQLIRSTSDEIRPHVQFVIATYGMMARNTGNLVQTLKDWDPHVVICDEWHNARNINTKTFINIHRVIRTPSVQYFWPLTGTPIERHADDLYGVMSLIDGDTMRRHNLSTYSKFRAKFCLTKRVKYGNMRQAQTQVCGSQNMQMLNKLLYNPDAPFAVRRTFEDIKQHMPKVRFRDIEVELKPSQALKELTHQMSNADFVDDQGVLNIDGRGATLHAMLGAEKAPAVASYVDEVLRSKPNNRGILVGFWHTECGETIYKALAKRYRVEFIDGGTPVKQRMMIEKQVNGGFCDVVVAQIQSCREALNFQEGFDHVVFAELSWSPAYDEQFYKRVARRGQTNPVQVDRCMTDHPSEGAKPQSQDTKANNAEKILEKNHG